jgi:enoyl-CoA hydratase
VNSALLTGSRDGILLITINRPEARNAVDNAVASGIAGALDELDSDDTLRAAVITGTGGFFCAGMDLKAFVAGESVHIGDRGFAGIAERASDKPLIAAVEGFAVAGGIEIALACDIIVAARDARFGIPEVKRGLVAAAGGLIRLPRRIPHHVAMELALTGDFLSAERAAELGLVNRLADPGAALDTALQLAASIGANAPLAVLASKRIISEQRGWSEAEQWQRQAVITEPVFASADAREGAVAFAEKRAPRWTGT